MAKRKTKRALIVIDVQNGFVSPVTEYVLPNIRAYIDGFDGDLSIGTRFVNRGGGFKDILNWSRLVDSPETNVLDFVEKGVEHLIEKNIYSAYTDEVKRLIKDNGIGEVYLIGIDTDCCVLKTAIDLFEDNIRPIVVSSCCASNGGKDSHEAAIKVLGRTIGVKQIEK